MTLSASNPTQSLNQAPFYRPELFNTPDIYLSSLKHFMAAFPLRAAWIVHENDALNTVEMVVGLPQKADLSAAESAKLAALTSAGKGDRLNQPIAINDKLVSYLYPVGKSETGTLFLLLLAKQPLSTQQQQWVTHESQLLSQLLELSCLNQHFKAEVAALEQVLQKVGHQLGNPLALIKLHAETLSMQLQQSPYREQTALICKATERLKTQFAQLMQYGKNGYLQLVRTDLTQILSESVQDLTPLIEQKGLRLSLSAPPLLLPVDPVQLKQVFDNVLSNAIAFSPPSSTITCEWYVFAQEVLVQINDEGPGLSEKDLQQVFQPYYSQREGGEGLGLAIAQKIILSHQGRLWAENLPSGGAQFSFTLPLPPSPRER